MVLYRLNIMQRCGNVFIIKFSPKKKNHRPTKVDTLEMRMLAEASKTIELKEEFGIVRHTSTGTYTEPLPLFTYRYFYGIQLETETGYS